MICWFAIDLRPLQPTNHYCLTINFNLFMDREWITTSELLAYLKAHPDDEKECRLYLGHRLGSTHYWQWSSQEQTFMHTRDWPPSSIRESEIIDRYGDYKWKIEQ